jgi:hypothetical protein
MGVTRDEAAPIRVPLTAEGATPHARDNRCLNCNATLEGPFCAKCGQRAIPAYPTVRELASDAFHEMSGWDGRFANTLRMLFRRPGQLTYDFLNGRRARYISPIRLYLVASVFYFLSAAASPSMSKNPSIAEIGGVRFGVFIPATDGAPATTTRDVQAARAGTLTPEQRQVALDSIEKAPALIRPVLRRSVTDPGGFQNSILRTLPRLLIALLPVFAVILALFYRGRRYPEHLYFAIHFHAFIFLALSIAQLAQITRYAPLVIGTGLLAAIWIPVYAIASLRRVYGGSLPVTMAKGAGAALLYTIVALPAMFTLLAWAATLG